jgi:hypothetical protein
MLPMGSEATAGRWSLHARVPRTARLRIVRDGVAVSEVEDEAIDYVTTTAGVYRVDARIEAEGRERTWIVSNPIYLRAES